MTRYYYLGPGNQPQGPILPTEFLSHGLNADSQVCPEGGHTVAPDTRRARLSQLSSAVAGR